MELQMFTRNTNPSIWVLDAQSLTSRTAGLAQKQLSKEFVREWLIENGFMGKEGQSVPTMTDDFVLLVSDRYIELFENIIGEPFVKQEVDEHEIERVVNTYFDNL